MHGSAVIGNEREAEETAPKGATAPQSGSITVIEPPKGWRLINVGELWRYRELLFFLTWRDVKVRYKQTLLGAGWAILQPVMMMVVFTIFFGRLAKLPAGDLPYPIFVFAGVLPWTFFATAIASAGNSVVGSERLITKIYFPRLAFPFAAVGAAVGEFAIAFGVLGVMMLYYLMKGAKIHPGPGLLLTPVIFGLIALAATGVGTLLAALNVAYRDFRYVIPFLIQFWMFATPTIYMQPAADSGPRAAILLNPMAGLVAAFRAATVGGPLPWGQLGGCAVVCVGLFLGGCLYFRKLEDGFADLI
jgi:lipopolysaccharide transport system permease protein